MSKDVKEVPLRDLFNLVGGYLLILRRRWLWLLIGGALLSGYMAYQASITPRVYAADLTFIVNEETNSGAGIGSILGQFGLGGGATQKYNTAKIIALGQSQKIMNELLLDTLVIGDEADLLANHIIKHQLLVQKWEMSPDVKISASTLEELDYGERGLLKQLYLYLLESSERILSMRADGDTGILTVTAQSHSEELALRLAEEAYRRVSDFYTLESVSSSQASVERLQLKVDSIRGALESAEYRLAALIDTRQGITQRRDLVRQTQLNREVSILNIAYGEVLRNYETAAFALSTKTPFFQEVDMPFLPLQVTSRSALMQGIIGFIGGAFVVFAIFAARKFYLDVMRDGTVDAYAHA